MTRRTSLALTAGAVGAGLPRWPRAAAVAPAAGGGKLTDDKVVLGVLNDQSGVYKDLSGPNSKVAVEMAIDDYKAKYGDKAVAKNIEVVTADHQNKPDIANTKAQEMYDRQKADIILDVPTSSAALAVADVAKEKKKLYFNIGAGTTALTGKSVQQVHVPLRLRHLHAGPRHRRRRSPSDGGKNWYIVYPDYAFGQDMQKSFTDGRSTKAGGTVAADDADAVPERQLRHVHHQGVEPTRSPTSSASMHAGGDLVNFVKQYNQSGLKGKTPAGRRADVHHRHPLARRRPVRRAPRSPTPGTGTSTTRTAPSPTGSRRRPAAGPTFAHAANYSAAHATTSRRCRPPAPTTPTAVVKRLEGKKINDVFLRNGEIRAADHRVIHDAYLAKVKPQGRGHGGRGTTRRSSRPSPPPRRSTPLADCDVTTAPDAGCRHRMTRD